MIEGETMSHYHGMQDLSGLPEHCRVDYQPSREDRFGWMFPHLAHSYVSPTVLQSIGKAGGPMDNGGSSDRTSSVPVGMVIFGQFIDHDITLDTSSSFASVNHPSETANVRTPTLDLDSIYGNGPEAQPYLYNQTAPFNNAKLLTGADEVGADDRRKNDLLRVPTGSAIIGDPRNDENRIISQMQLGFIKFHNAICDKLRAEATAEGHDLKGEELFEEARREVTWHYQWVVVNDFLVSMCGKAVVDDVLSQGRRFYQCSVPFIPIEFAVAAYRFGHSMVPMKIQVQKGDIPFEFFGQILGRGFSPVGDTRAVVDWHELFFTSENRVVQRAEKLDTLMAGDLLELPFVPDGGEKSLATRNLLRGNSFRLPGGDTIAREMGRAEAEVGAVMARINAISNGEVTSGAPLWLYILAEAEVVGRESSPGNFEPGEGLGPVGARIVVEVLIGLLELDPESYLGSNRNWMPSNAYDTVGKMLSSVNSDLL
jgi:hypothetical protein